MAARECGILAHNPIYFFTMIVFPIFIVFFFTSMMNSGVPQELPCGIVDLDNTSTTRSLIRRLDAMETTRVAATYSNVNEARSAIQRGEIYAFLYIPRNTTSDLMAQRQPSISIYYSSVVMMAGALLYRDMRIVGMLGSLSVAATKLSALGKNEGEIKSFVQPIAVDVHPVNNPGINYNVYLSTFMVPGVLMLFFFIVTVYSVGTELKFNRSREWMQLSGGNAWVAITGKLLPQFLIFFSMMAFYMLYVFGVMGFPHQGGLLRILLLAVLTVTSAEGFAVFMFCIMPSLRMSMSICSLWAVLGLSMGGATYPVFAMDGELETLSWLFPLRHYYMIYQIAVFNGYPLSDCWIHVVILTAFSLMPLLDAHRLRKAMIEYVYIP